MEIRMRWHALCRKATIFSLVNENWAIFEPPYNTVLNSPIDLIRFA